MKQSHADSVMESVANVGTGFIISLGVMAFIVSPLFGFHTNAGENLAITGIFTVTSLLRSYVLRRVFNGRTIWQTIKDTFA